MPVGLKILVKYSTTVPIFRMVRKTTDIPSKPSNDNAKKANANTCTLLRCKTCVVPNWWEAISTKTMKSFATPWDLIIVDEAHEGTQTELGKAVMQELVKPETKVLRLSGTPFNLLDDFKEEEIYTWDYVMEQRAKANWDKIHFGDPNPYAELPRLNIFTYDLGKLLPNYADEDLAFNFHEFFRVNADGQFIHENDVRSFLNLISKKGRRKQLSLFHRGISEQLPPFALDGSGCQGSAGIQCNVEGTPCIFAIHDRECGRRRRRGRSQRRCP
jgi:hypothetical protein